MKGRIIITLIIMTLIITSIIPMGQTNAEITEQPTTLATHSPITIITNSGFTGANGVSSGNGSEGNPYIIDNLEIGHYPIQRGFNIRDTTAHFIIRNCTIFNATSTIGSATGILAYNVDNMTIDNCTIYGNMIGISISQSRDIVITNCTLHDSTMRVIFISQSDYISIEDNSIYDAPAGVGIQLQTSDLCIIENCDLYNLNRGIHPNGCEDIYVTNCSIYNCSTGVDSISLLIQSSNITTTGCLIYNNDIGIWLTSDQSSLIFHNNIFNNTDNAHEDSSIVATRWDDGTEGNYWGDYTGIDGDSDGIGDTPYNITSSGDIFANQDRYPLVYPPPVADAGIDRTVSTGIYAFDASGSYDLEGEIVNYTWNFTYDEDDIELYGINTSFDFQKEGSYLVTLNVTDTYDAYDTDTLLITVEEEVELTAWQILQSTFIGIITLAIIIIFFKKMKEGLEEDFGGI